MGEFVRGQLSLRSSSAHRLRRKLSSPGFGRVRLCGSSASKLSGGLFDQASPSITNGIPPPSPPLSRSDPSPNTASAIGLYAGRSDERCETDALDYLIRNHFGNAFFVAV